MGWVHQWVGLRWVWSIFCSDGWGRVGSIVLYPEMYTGLLLIVNSCQNGSGRVDGYNFLMGRVVLGHFHCGSGPVGSKNLDPCPTLGQIILFRADSGSQVTDDPCDP